MRNGIGRLLAAVAVVTATGASLSSAAITIDGTRDAAYGGALGVQLNGTQFGDSSTGSTSTANGSEIDAVYARVDAGTLYVLATGNLETNFNKLDFFIDNGTNTGSTTLGTLANNQGNFNNMSGLTFDSAFKSNRWVSVTAGNDPTTIFVDTADTTVTGANGFYAGRSAPVTNGTLSEGNGGPASLRVTLNNSNTAGVTGTDAAGAASVATGVEIAISLADLGYVSGDLRIAAFINGSGQDFLSNQVIGSLPAGTGNLGTPSLVNFQNITGDQFVTLAVPEPTTLAALGAGALVFARRRRA